MKSKPTTLEGYIRQAIWFILNTGPVLHQIMLFLIAYLPFQQAERCILGHTDLSPPEHEPRGTLSQRVGGNWKGKGQPGSEGVAAEDQRNLQVQRAMYCTTFLATKSYPSPFSTMQLAENSPSTLAKHEILISTQN